MHEGARHGSPGGYGGRVRSPGPQVNRPFRIGFHCFGPCVENQATSVVLISLGLIESIFPVWNNPLFHVPSFVI